MTNRNNLKLVFTALCAAAGATASAQQTIINTYGNYNGNEFLLSSGEAFGQTVHVNGGSFALTELDFEFIAPDNYLSDIVGVNLSLYADTGPNNAPASVPFYSSGIYYNGNNNLGPGNGQSPSSSGQTITYSLADGDFPGNLTLPSSFTIAITFTNIDAPNTPFVTGGNGHVALPIATNNNTYASTVENDYWVNNNGVWTEYTNAAGNNVLFNVEGVPEPSVLGLGAAASLFILGANRLRRKA